MSYLPTISYDEFKAIQDFPVTKLIDDQLRKLQRLNDHLESENKILRAEYEKLEAIKSNACPHHCPECEIDRLKRKLDEMSGEDE